MWATSAAKNGVYRLLWTKVLMLVVDCTGTGHRQASPAVCAARGCMSPS